MILKRVGKGKASSRKMLGDWKTGISSPGKSILLRKRGVTVGCAGLSLKHARAEAKKGH
jgi:hypothetical protein